MYKNFLANHRHTLYSLALFFGILAYGYSPILKSGFYSDDATNSTVLGACRAENISIWEYNIRDVMNIADTGRILYSPLFNYFFYIFPEVEVFKIYQAILFFLNLFLFYILLGQLKLNKDFKLFVVLGLSLFIQVIQGHDPVTGFGGMLQWLLSFIFLCLYSQFRFMHGKNKRSYFWLLGFILFFGLSLMMYELGIICVLLIGFIEIETFKWNKKRGTLLLVVGILILAGYFFTQFHLRRHLSLQSVAFGSMNPIIIGKTLLKQLSGALPLSNFIFSPRQYTYFIDGEKRTLAAQIIEQLKNPFFLLWLTVLFVTLKRCLSKLELSFESTGILVRLGATFLFFPCMLLSLSATYQNAIGWGSSYLPVYLQYFGISVLFSVGIGCLLRKYRSLLFHCAIALFLSSLIAFNFIRNKQIVLANNINQKHERIAFEEVLKLGLLKNVPEGASVYFKNSTYLGGASHKLVYTYSPEEIITKLRTMTMKWSKEAPDKSDWTVHFNKVSTSSYEFYLYDPSGNLNESWMLSSQATPGSRPLSQNRIRRLSNEPGLVHFLNYTQLRKVFGKS